ncbi:hypothetical protein FOL47_004759 [Perkinsus chesapeaki]|uniref:Uncharacterized protein n=1 Tax=Perkinsus chesapeaki TaxID=330153 RepID=A0A7J6MZ01_PERCH|nr:hypothetical protein FOL47_004759 [Perkinsus chesapeaki]
MGGSPTGQDSDASPLAEAKAEFTPLRPYSKRSRISQARNTSSVIDPRSPEVAKPLVFDCDAEVVEVRSSPARSTPQKPPKRPKIPLGGSSSSKSPLESIDENAPPRENDINTHRAVVPDPTRPEERPNERAVSLDCLKKARKTAQEETPGNEEKLPLDCTSLESSASSNSEIEERGGTNEPLVSQKANDGIKEREESDLFTKLVEYFRGSPSKVETSIGGGKEQVGTSENGTDNTKSKEWIGTSENGTVNRKNEECIGTSENGTDNTGSEKSISSREMGPPERVEGDQVDDVLRETVATVVAELSGRAARKTEDDESQLVEIAIDPLTGSFAVVEAGMQSLIEEESLSEEVTSEEQAEVAPVQGDTKSNGNDEEIDCDEVEHGAADSELDNVKRGSSEAVECEPESAEESGILGRMSRLINSEIQLALENWGNGKEDGGAVSSVEEMEEFQSRETMDETKNEGAQRKADDIEEKKSPTVFDRLFSLVVANETSETVKEPVKKGSHTSTPANASNGDGNFRSQEGHEIVQLVDELSERPDRGDSDKLGFWDRLMQPRSGKKPATSTSRSDVVEKPANSPGSSTRSPTSVAWSRFKGMFDNSKNTKATVLPEAPLRDGSYRNRRASELTSEKLEESMRA